MIMDHMMSHFWSFLRQSQTSEINLDNCLQFIIAKNRFYQINKKNFSTLLADGKMTVHRDCKMVLHVVYGSSSTWHFSEYISLFYLSSIVNPVNNRHVINTYKPWFVGCKYFQGMSIDREVYNHKSPWNGTTHESPKEYQCT